MLAGKFGISKIEMQCRVYEKACESEWNRIVVQGRSATKGFKVRADVESGKRVGV